MNHPRRWPKVVDGWPSFVNVGLSVIAVLAMASGAVIAIFGHNLLQWSPPPQPPAWAAAGPGVTGVSPANVVAAARHHLSTRPMARSAPVRVAIPRIGVDAQVIGLGLTASGATAVPPISRPFVTSWYDRGSSPGQPGPAVLLGHVDAQAVGPAVFYRLGDLRPGDLVYVTLLDRRVTVFAVSSVALYLKPDFPTALVYGPTRLPTLRLITCGGAFDRKTRHYDGNVIAFATFLGSKAVR